MSKTFAKIAIVVFLSLIILDFVFYKLKKDFPLSFWRRQWLMFSFSDDRLSKLIVYGTLQNGEKIKVPMEHWFTYPVGFETARYNEISKQQDTLTQLADYVCAQFNANSSKHIISVSLYSAVWNKDRGKRLALREVPVDKLRMYPHIQNHLCHAK
jgi:hypothetical protein